MGGSSEVRVGESGKRRDHVASSMLQIPAKRKRTETIENQSHRRRSSAAMLGVGLVRQPGSPGRCRGSFPAPCERCPALRGRKSGNCRHGQLPLQRAAAAPATQRLGIRDTLTLTLSSSTSLNACPGSPNQR